MMWHGSSVGAFVAQSLFWRLGYNVGLGFVLYSQSSGERLTALVRKMLAANNWATRSLRLFYPAQYDAYPVEFRAWMVFRCLVDIVLGLDVISFVTLCWRCWEPIDGVLDALSIFVGVLLFGAALWVKIDAHKVVGDYAWHWGDFFFRKECTLIFGGVFNMFPHPMYGRAPV